MKILILGDIMGPSGMKAIKERLPDLIKEKDFSTDKLAEKIRNNEIDISDKSFIDFLYKLTEKKIDIDNPKYKKFDTPWALCSKLILAMIHVWKKIS